MSSTGGPSRNTHRRRRGGGGAPALARGAATAAATAAAPARAPPVQQNLVVPAALPPKANDNLSTTRFAEFYQRRLISKNLLDNIPFEFCTEVQAATMDTILSGVDVFARAKTGTGKTVAFLLPIVTRLESRPPPNDKIAMLIISPTRDLTLQIQAEAQKLTQGTRLGVQAVIGGTNIASEKKRLTQQRADILIATPGRLLDHFENSGLREKLSEVQTFVLDEADRLLDQGFAPAVEQIVKALPNRARIPRQSLLFSATVAPKVREVAKLALLPNYKFISTVKESDSATHEHVPQQYSLVPLHQQLAATAAFLAAANSGPSSPLKAIVFVNTAREAAMYHAVFELLQPAGLPAFEMHSRLTQSKRAKEIEAFRAAATGVMFASDVIARGIDIPDVTAVLQVGAPAEVDTYVHRLGRTARAGKDGQGLVFLDPVEESILPKLPGGQLVKGVPPAGIEAWQEKLVPVLDRIDDQTKSQVYAAWIGFSKSSKWVKLSPSELLQKANEHVLQTLRYKGDGSGRPPPLMARTVGKMGFKGPERKLLNIVSQLPGQKTMRR